MPIEVCLFPQTVHTLPLEETPLEIQKQFLAPSGTKERGKGVDDTRPDHFTIKANILESIVLGQWEWSTLAIRNVKKSPPL